MKRAVFYALTFLFVQLVVTYFVCSAWLMATGMPAATAIQTTLTGKLVFNIPMLLAANATADVVLLFMFLKLRWCETSPKYLRTRPWTVFFWCFIAGLGTIVPAQFLQEMLPELPNIAEESLKNMLTTPFGFVVICILASIVEEVVFRGAILRSLLGWTHSLWTAIVVSALLFAVVHMNPAQMPHAFVAGLLLGWMFCRTGSILPGILYHWVNNTFVYVWTNLMPQAADMTLRELFGGSEARVLLALGCSLLILLPALFQLNIRMKKAGENTK